MSTEANKAIVVRLMEELFNNRIEAVWDELAQAPGSEVAA